MTGTTYSVLITNNIFVSVFSVDDKSDAESVDEDDENSFESTLTRLRDKHAGTIADFKLKCWAKMLVISFSFIVVFFTSFGINSKLVLSKLLHCIIIEQAAFTC